MKKLIRKLARTLTRSALRSIRNTFRYEAPAIGRFVARQLRRPPVPAKSPAQLVPQPRVARAAKPAPAVKPRITELAPAPLRHSPARRQLFAEAMQLKTAIDHCTTLAEYQELSVRYQRTIAAIAALSTPDKPTRVKSHKRSGSKVRSYTRGA